MHTGMYLPCIYKSAIGVARTFRSQAVYPICCSLSTSVESAAADQKQPKMSTTTAISEVSEVPVGGGGGDVDNGSSRAAVTLSVLLREQYQCTEHYCNASTALHNQIQQQQQQHRHRQHNGIGTATTDLLRSTQNYQDTLHQLQTCMKSLETIIMDMAEESCHGNRPLLECLLQEHLERSRRILGTIYSSGEGSCFHANGLPTPKQSLSDIVNSRLVALSTLRASIKTVSDRL